MGLSASQARFLSLTSRKSAIEFKGQQINQQRMVLSSVEQQFATRMTEVMQETINDADGNPISAFSGLDMDPITGKFVGSNAVIDEYNDLIDEITAINATDRVLEQKLKDVDTQHTEVQTEIDAVKKVIDKNIEMTFKTFA